MNEIPSGGSPERLLGDIVYDKGLEGKFLGIRIRQDDGLKIGTVLVHSNDYREVCAAIQKDQKDYGLSTVYYFFKPRNKDDQKREGWIIGEEGSESNVIM